MLVLSFVLAALVAAAVIARLSRFVRAGDGPRIVWGATPLTNFKYWSRAVASLGHDSTTVVKTLYPIHAADDFDFVLDRMSLGPKPLRRFDPYVMFCWSLSRFDVFVLSFDGWLLADTPLGPLEGALLKLAGRSVIVVPYGSDIALQGYLGPLEDAVFATYPRLRDNAAQVKRRVDHYSKWADLVIRTLQPGYYPRVDIVIPNILAIDTDLWQAESPSSTVDGVTAEVVVAHASNHRALKGTDEIIRAVDELRDEGIKVRLRLLEKLSNAAVREAILAADIVVDQVVAGYGLAAVEAMSAGKPVLSNLSWLAAEFGDSVWLRSCPLVDADAATLKDRLRTLIANPAMRDEIGRRSREFVLRHNSIPAVATMWDAIFRQVHGGRSRGAEPLAATSDDAIDTRA